MASYLAGLGVATLGRGLLGVEEARLEGVFALAASAALVDEGALGGESAMEATADLVQDGIAAFIGEVALEATADFTYDGAWPGYVALEGHADFVVTSDEFEFGLIALSGEADLVYDGIDLEDPGDWTVEATADVELIDGMPGGSWGIEADGNADGWLPYPTPIELGAFDPAATGELSWSVNAREDFTIESEAFTSWTGYDTEIGRISETATASISYVGYLGAEFTLEDLAELGIAGAVVEIGNTVMVGEGDLLFDGELALDGTFAMSGTADLGYAGAWAALLEIEGTADITWDGQKGTGFDIEVNAAIAWDGIDAGVGAWAAVGTGELTYEGVFSTPTSAFGLGTTAQYTIAQWRVGIDIVDESSYFEMEAHGDLIFGGAIFGESVAIQADAFLGYNGQFGPGGAAFTFEATAELTWFGLLAELGDFKPIEAHGDIHWFWNPYLCQGNSGVNSVPESGDVNQVPVPAWIGSTLPASDVRAVPPPSDVEFCERHGRNCKHDH